jgi:hypothetical protein
MRMCKSIRALAISGAILIASPLALTAFAPLLDPQRGYDRDWDGNYERLTRINPGTYVDVRTTEPIDSDRADGRIFRGVVDEDVWDDYGRLAVAAIPRGSRVELTVRTARDGDLILDLESIEAHGQRYAIEARPDRVENDRRDEFGGDILGSILGSVTGARGRSLRVPAGTRLTFRLTEGLNMGTTDRGYDQGERHFHRFTPDSPDRR